MRTPLWLLPLSLSLAACGPCDQQDLEDFARDSAGDGAIHCGTVPVGESAAEAHACLTASFEAGTPALAVVEEDDRTVAWAVRGDGSFLKLIYLDNGGDPTIDVGRCPEARAVSSARAIEQRVLLECKTPQEELRSVRVCG